MKFKYLTVYYHNIHIIHIYQPSLKSKNYYLLVTDIRIEINLRTYFADKYLELLDQVTQMVKNTQTYTMKRCGHLVTIETGSWGN